MQTISLKFLDVFNSFAHPSFFFKKAARMVQRINFFSWKYWLSETPVEKTNKVEGIFSKVHIPPSEPSASQKAFRPLSAYLPSFTFKAATLENTTDGNHLCFTFVLKQKKQHIFFDDENALNSWIEEEGLADIWEITDLRTTSKIFYKLLRLDETRYDDTNREELFTKLSSEFGVLWKLNNLDDHTTKYFHEKRNFWNQAIYDEVPFDKLSDIAKTLKAEAYGEQPPHAFLPGKTTLMLSVCFVIARAVGNTPLQIAGGLSLLNLAQAANSPPIATNTLPEITFYPGQNPFNQTFSSDIFFSDPDGDTVSVTPSSIPSFAQVYITKLNTSHLDVTFNSLIANSIQRAGTLLHVFGNSLYQLWDTTSPSLQLLGTYMPPSALRQGVVYGNFAYLADASEVKFLQITNPRSPLEVYSLSAGQTNWFGVGLNGVSNKAFVSQLSGGNQYISAYSVNNPASPVYLGGYLAPCTSTVFADTNALVYFACNNNLYVLNGTQSTPVFYGSIAAPLSYFPRDKFVYTVPQPSSGANGLQVYDITNLSRIGNYNATTATSVTISGPYAFLSSSSALTILDISNPSQPTFYASSPLLSGTSVAVLRNSFYVANQYTIARASLNDITFLASPTWQDRGDYTLTLSANDGRSGMTNFNLTLHVVVRPPVLLNPIPSQRAYAQVPFQLNVNGVFLTPDGAPLTLFAEGLPNWLILNNSSILSGTPLEMDTGQQEVTLTAVDPFGQNASDTFTISVTSLFTNSQSNPTVSNPTTSNPTLTNPTDSNTNTSNPTDSNQRSSNDIVLPITLSIVGTTLFITGLVVSVILARRIRHRTPPSSTIAHSTHSSWEGSINRLELSPKTKSNIKGVFGKLDEEKGSYLYAWLNFTPDEKEAILKETGLRVHNDKGKIASGNYGEIRICWSLWSNEYVVAKVVEGEANWKASDEEAELQREAEGEGVWPIYHTIRDHANDTLIHLMPIAKLGNLESVQLKIKKQKIKDVTAYATILAQDILQGLVTMHSKKIYHCDTKPSNILVSLDRCGLTDLGRSIKSITASRIKSRVSDYRYQSPERLCFNVFEADFDDAWAAGCSLLEFLTGESIEELFPFERHPNVFPPLNIDEMRKAFQLYLDKIPQLKNPPVDSIWYVLKNALQVDFKNRWLPAKLLTAACFKSLKNVNRTALFNILKTSEKASKKAETTTQTVSDLAPILDNEREEAAKIYVHGVDDKYYQTTG